MFRVSNYIGSFVTRVCLVWSSGGEPMMFRMQAGPQLRRDHNPFEGSIRSNDQGRAENLQLGDERP